MFKILTEVLLQKEASMLERYRGSEVKEFAGFPFACFTMGNVSMSSTSSVPA